MPRRDPAACLLQVARQRFAAAGGGHLPEVGERGQEQTEEQEEVVDADFEVTR
jgi:hypothetical protein